MDFGKACEQVENYLVDEAMKYASLNKVKSKLYPAAQAEQKTEVPKQTQTQTLSNKAPPSSQRLSAKERIERAKAAFEGRLT
jgi:hypothetical protein